VFFTVSLFTFIACPSRVFPTNIRSPSSCTVWKSNQKYITVAKAGLCSCRSGDRHKPLSSSQFLPHCSQYVCFSSACPRQNFDNITLGCFRLRRCYSHPAFSATRSFPRFQWPCTNGYVADSNRIRNTGFSRGSYDFHASRKFVSLIRIAICALYVDRTSNRRIPFLGGVLIMAGGTILFGTSY
jgi:hypothetical protein